MSWFNSSLTEFVEKLNSLASSLKYERVLGLKKSLISSLIRVFEAMSPVNRLSKKQPCVE